MSTTLDRLLDGRVALHQPETGYRAGMDAVLLAAALEARPDEQLVEFGCGAGAALLCAATRLETARFMGVERDALAAELARENVMMNRLTDRVRIAHGDITALGPEVRADQVFFNPPFFDDPSALRPPKPEKRGAWLSGEAPLPDWIRAAARVLTAKGRLTLIHRADRLADILAALEKSFGSVAIRPVLPRADQPAKRVLVTARIGGRAPLVLHAPFVLHEGETHSPAAEAVLRGRTAIAL